jgi:16S rRNA (cytosine1402-N4)-methyltransferase
VAVASTRKRLSFIGEHVHVVRASYAELDFVLRDLAITTGIDGVALDLGMSTYQLDKSGRGFSFYKDEPLDMRMDPAIQKTAYDVVNQYHLDDIEGILRKYGEERKAKRIAKAIVRARSKGPIETSLHLAGIIQSVSRPARHSVSRHPATRTFQALRIAVNDELENLGVFLNRIPSILKRGGRLVILSYHSLEDRMVKRAMKAWEDVCTCPKDFPRCVCGNKPLFRRVLKKGKRPGRMEIQENPRARSAILRVSERV